MHLMITPLSMRLLIFLPLLPPLINLLHLLTRLLLQCWIQPQPLQVIYQLALRFDVVFLSTLSFA